MRESKPLSPRSSREPHRSKGTPMDEVSVQKVMARTAQSVSFLALLLFVLILFDNYWVAARAFGWSAKGFDTERVITPNVVVTALGATTLGVAAPLAWAIHGHYALKRGK